MRRYELSDFEWGIIEPHLPNKVRWVARVDDRKVLNGILWRFRTGSPWADVPERYGPHTTCYNRFVRWRKAGVWDRLLAAVSKAFDGEVIMIDLLCPRPPARSHGKKGGDDDGCMGRGGYSFDSTRITSDSGTTPSKAIASAAALLCIIADSLSISGTSIISATRFGFCGSTKVRMLVIPSAPNNSLRFGELSQCLVSFVML